MQFKSYIEMSEGDLKSRVLDFIDQQSKGAEIIDIIKGLNLSDDVTLRGQPGFDHNQGHHQSELNRTLVDLVQSGQLRHEEIGWSQKPKFFRAR
jgi:hypothetical protein